MSEAKAGSGDRRRRPSSFRQLSAAHGCSCLADSVALFNARAARWTLFDWILGSAAVLPRYIRRVAPARACCPVLPPRPRGFLLRALAGGSRDDEPAPSRGRATAVGATTALVTLGRSPTASS